MSIRRINSTGRIKILRDHVRISVREDSINGLGFDASVDLSSYDLPDSACVFVEAYRQTTFMRFPFGTKAAPRLADTTNCWLKEFSAAEGILFRVKVTSTRGRSGVLLDEADRIPIGDPQEADEKRVPLLPPVPQDLGQQLWRLDFEGSSGPLLLVNSKVDDWKTLAGSTLFRALVYPEAMRAVLWHVYKVEETREVDDLQNWRCRWLLFASSLPGVGQPPLSSSDDADWAEWIQDAVSSFCRRHKMLDISRQAIAE